MSKVVLGFSGGVDSTAAAIILKNQGYEVIGLYFDVLSQQEFSGKEKAESVAKELGIDFIYKNVSSEFAETILKYFENEYLNGCTPIPCVFCNPLIKFKTLLSAADDLGADYIASGHYARVEKIDDYYFVRKAANSLKDQAYMLARLGQDVLSRVIFPLGEYDSKDNVRALVRDLSISNSETKDSQDICFIPDGDYRAYLKQHGFNDNPGNYVDSNGTVLGKHNGSFNYTIGQRKGLGIAMGHPVFVTKIDAHNNLVYLGEESELFKYQVKIKNLFISDSYLTKLSNDLGILKKYTCKLRYAAKPALCTISFDDSRSYAMLTFDEPQRAPAPGQAAVLYDGEIVIGCGIICD